MPTPARWHADAAAILEREQSRIPTPPPPHAWPMTPEEREAIPDYGDLVSSIIWYPIWANDAERKGPIVCGNCGGDFKDHDVHDGLCRAFDGPPIDPQMSCICSAPDGDPANVTICEKHWPLERVAVKDPDEVADLSELPSWHEGVIKAMDR